MGVPLSCPCSPPPCPFFCWGVYLNLTGTVEIWHSWCFCQSLETALPQSHRVVSAKKQHTVDQNTQLVMVLPKMGLIFCPPSHFSAFVIGTKGSLLFHKTIATWPITGNQKQNCPRELCGCLPPSRSPGFLSWFPLKRPSEALWNLQLV